MQLGEVLVVQLLELEPDVDARAWERFVTSELARAWTAGLPGTELHLFMGDRGARKGRYALVWTIETVARREAGGHPDSRAPFGWDLLERARKAGPARFMDAIAGTGAGAEYHLIEPESVGPLPQVEVLGIHYLKVRPDRRDAFERFVRATLHPAVGNLRPDLRILYYKAVRGDQTSSDIALFALTVASRDKYWPGGADSDELRAAFTPVQALTGELSTYLVEGSYLSDPKFAAAVYESREWADFVRIAPQSR
ncbi:MAG TPA: hypothetical protein VD833_26370 [Vicinamibacterales bacterium]|nr:hypothetical protein [Vicinamibacterales bacterium]